MKNIASFLKTLEWWNLYPASEILIEQPGDKQYNEFISVTKTPDNKTIVLYVPVKTQVKIRKPLMRQYLVKWFNPVSGKYTDGVITDKGSVMEFSPPEETDMVAVLKIKK